MGVFSLLLFIGMVLDNVGMCEPAGWQQGKINEARLCSVCLQLYTVCLVPLGYNSAHTYITELMQKTDEQSVSIDEVEYPTLWLYKKINCKSTQENYFVPTLNQLLSFLKQGCVIYFPSTTAVKQPTPPKGGKKKTQDGKDGDLSINGP